MRTSIVIGIIFICSCVLAAQSSNSRSLGEIKEWQLKSPHGDITIKLSARPHSNDSHMVLSIEPEDGSIPPASEEANLLARVLDEMPSLGYDPRKLEMISTWLQNTEYRQGVQRSLIKSRKWKSCVGQKYCREAGAVADQYLASIDAFKPLDDVLRAHGLMRRSVTIDDMGVGTESGRVSCSGLIVIALGKTER